MTVMEMLRGARPSDADGEGAPQSRLPESWREVLIGLVTGIASLLVVLVPTALGWMLDPRPGASLAEPLGAGASLWLLVQGAHLGAGATVIAFVPLLLGAFAVWGAARGADRALATADTEDSWWADLLPRSVAAAAGRWWIGYAVAVALASLLTLAGSLPLRWVSLVAPLVVVPGLALALSVRRRSRDAEVLGPRFHRFVAPETVRRAWGPATRGLRLVLGVALLFVVVAVVLRWGSVTQLHGEIGAGFLGGLLLVGAQVASLPNLALWVVGLLTGPGFSVVEGAHTSWSGTTSGLMPLVPIFGAMPEPGPYPWFVHLLVLGPVAIGGYIGRRALSSVARLSSLRTKASVAAVACLMVALAVAVLDALAGGSLGAYRLADIGTSALWTGLCLAAELMVGALVVVLWDAWRLRR